MYVLHNGSDYTDFIMGSLDSVSNLLLDEDFLSSYGMLFDECITGFRLVVIPDSSDVELIIQYWDGVWYEETSFYLRPVKFIK